MSQGPVVQWLGCPPASDLLLHFALLKWERKQADFAKSSSKRGDVMHQSILEMAAAPSVKLLWAAITPSQISASMALRADERMAEPEPMLLKDMRVERMPPDGQCLFHALS